MPFPGPLWESHEKTVTEHTIWRLWGALSVPSPLPCSERAILTASPNHRWGQARVPGSKHSPGCCCNWQNQVLPPWQGESKACPTLSPNSLAGSALSPPAVACWVMPSLVTVPRSYFLTPLQRLPGTLAHGNHLHLKS